MVKRGITLTGAQEAELASLGEEKKRRAFKPVIMVEIWCFYQMIMSLTEGRLHTEMKL